MKHTKNSVFNTAIIMTIKFVLTLSTYWNPILDKSLEKLFKDATNKEYALELKKEKTKK